MLVVIRSQTTLQRLLLCSPGGSSGGQHPDSRKTKQRMTPSAVPSSQTIPPSLRGLTASPWVLHWCRGTHSGCSGLGSRLAAHNSCSFLPASTPEEGAGTSTVLKGYKTPGGLSHLKAPQQQGRGRGPRATCLNLLLTPAKLL